MTSDWRAFRIQEGDFRYQLDAWHGCGLMGAECPVCGIWATTGLSYPSIKCSTVSSVDERVFKYLDDVADDPQIMNMEEFRFVSNALSQALGVKRPINPGVEFGHLRGAGHGDFGDFAWPDSWTPVVRKPVFEAMLEAGFDLTGISTELELSGNIREKYIEIEALPTARLSTSSGVEICTVCGRAETENARRIIDAASFDDAIPVQRIWEFPTTVVVNAPFAQFVRDHNLSEITVTPLHVM